MRGVLSRTGRSSDMRARRGRRCRCRCDSAWQPTGIRRGRPYSWSPPNTDRRGATRPRPIGKLRPAAKQQARHVSRLSFQHRDVCAHLPVTRLLLVHDFPLTPCCFVVTDSEQRQAQVYACCVEAWIDFQHFAQLGRCFYGLVELQQNLREPQPDVMEVVANLERALILPDCFLEDVAFAVQITE